MHIYLFRWPNVPVPDRYVVAESLEKAAKHVEEILSLGAVEQVVYLGEATIVPARRIRTVRTKTKGDLDLNMPTPSKSSGGSFVDVPLPSQDRGDFPEPRSW